MHTNGSHAGSCAFPSSRGTFQESGGRTGGDETSKRDAAVRSNGRFWIARWTLATLALTGAALAAGEREQPAKDDEKEGLHTEVVVTASRKEQPLRDASSMATVISADQLDESPAFLLDQKLRRVPGFSLFRRSSSLIAHPTTQGVSLRGIGPSGTSRSLVLWNGIPLNDPFGGWVYWNRIPISALERVEFVRGASSQLYGSSAMGGVIQLLTPVQRNFRFSGRASVGGLGIRDVDATFADRAGGVNFQASARLFSSDGYIPVRSDLRGPIDRKANVGFQSVLGGLEYKSLQFGMNYYLENRNNGTELQTNRSEMFQVDVGLQRDRWEARWYVQDGVLESAFSRILPDRQQEFLTGEQRFDWTASGALLNWQFSDRSLVGADWRRVAWDDFDQNLAGVYAQHLVPLSPRMELQLGSRLDVWKSRGTQASLNPKVGLLLRAAAPVTLRGSVYRGFRAPTLNELYRPFRVGNILTEANPDLRAETLWGAEAGLDLHPTANLLLRVNSFWSRLDEAVSNVTVSIQPDLILRQRRNLGGARIRGFEAEFRWRVSSSWDFEAAYLLSDSTDAESQLRLPQTALHQGSAGIRYVGPVIASAGLRWVGRQFEDDLEELPLARFGVVDLLLSRPLRDDLSLELSVENLLDEVVSIGRTPWETIGQPRTIRAGLRFALR